MEKRYKKSTLHLFYVLVGNLNRCRVLFLCLYFNIFVILSLPCFCSFYSSIPTCKEFLKKFFSPSIIVSALRHNGPVSAVCCVYIVLYLKRTKMNETSGTF